MRLIVMSGFGGISKSLKYYEFAIDSFDGGQPFASGVSKLDWPIFQVGGKRPLRNIAAIKILEAQIPFSWYTLNSSNNTFILEEAGAAPITVTMTWSAPGDALVPAEGNYSISDYVGTNGLLTNSLNWASDANGVNTTFNSAYNDKVFKIEIWNNVATPGRQFILKFGNDATDPGNTNPRYLLGFGPGNNTSQGWNSTVGDYLQAPFVAQTTGPNYLYINSQRIGNLTDMYLPKGATNLGGGNSGPQMCKIPVDCQPGGIIYWRDPDPEKYFDLENLDTLSEIDFYLTLGNSSGQVPLKLNGGNFSLKLCILENDLSHTTTYTGTVQNNRVTKRIRFD